MTFILLYLLHFARAEFEVNTIIYREGVGCIRIEQYIHGLPWGPRDLRDDCDQDDYNLSCCDFSNRDLSSANLRNKYMDGAVMNSYTKLPSSLYGTKLRHASLQNINFNKIVVFNVDASGSDFSGANLTGAIGLDEKDATRIPRDELRRIFPANPHRTSLGGLAEIPVLFAGAILDAIKKRDSKTLTPIDLTDSIYNQETQKPFTVWEAVRKRRMIFISKYGEDRTYTSSSTGQILVPAKLTSASYNESPNISDHDPGVK